MNKYWKKAADAVAAYSKREKVMLLLAGVTIIIFLAFMRFIEPLYQQLDTTNRKITSHQRELNLTADQIALLGIQLSRDPDASVKESIVTVKENLTVVDRELQDLTVDFIPPHKMQQLLSEVLEQASDVTVIRLESLPSTPVLPQGTSQEASMTLYQHGISLIVEGDFFSIQQFLSRVEALPWKFYWNRFQYVVREHPLATLELEITTISADEDFIAI